MTPHFKQRARAEMNEVQDLARVLFKPRNGEAWTREDRAFLRRELAGLARRWAPGFFLFLLPGGVVLAPAYAWYLDRRRRGVIRVGGHRRNDPTPAQALAAAAVASR
jgi:hypothetical protein